MKVFQYCIAFYGFLLHLFLISVCTVVIFSCLGKFLLKFLLKNLET